MTADEIKALRRALDMTHRQLAGALDVDPKIVIAWEREELFPTKRHVEAMRALRDKLAEAKPPPPQGAGPFAALADPAVWALVRKILAHPELRAEVEGLAGKYADPAG